MDDTPSDLPEAIPSDRALSTAENVGARFHSSSAHPSFNDLKHFFDLALDLLCVAGLDGYFKYLNPAWTQDLGWTLEELKSRPFIDFVHPDDRVSTEAELRKLTQGMTTNLFENRYRHRDGGYRVLQWNASPGPINGRIYATARDITRQQLLECDIIEIADREKEHLGRELHDSGCQTIAGISALSTTLARNLRKTGDHGSADSATEITGLLNEALAQLRDLSHSLAPPVERDSEIGDLLEVLALQFERSYDVRCTVGCAGPPWTLSSELKTQLLRISQEALNNAVTHGHADLIEIDLRRRTGGRCQMTILDNGSGISGAVSAVDEGIGLRSMKYRAGLVGGQLTVRRRRRQGTAVICIFPMRADSADPESGEDGQD